MNGFTAKLDAEGPETVITLAGELDLGNADDVRSLGLTTLQVPNVWTVAFDMSAVTFLDSSGIGALLDVRNAAEEVSVKVQIDNASRPVARVLALTGLAVIFGVIDTD